MKRLLAVALVSIALTSFGAWERIGSVRLADVNSLVTGVTRLGEFTGNQMLGIMASQSVGQLPPIALFGPGRPNAAMSYVLFLDGDKLSGDPTEALESLEYAVLYPVAVTKDAFVKAHPGAVETNGFVCVCADADDADDDDDDDDEPCGGDVNYVVFSKDGKWAAYSDKPEQAKAALDEIKMAERKMDGDLAKVIVDKKGWAVVARALDAAAKGKDVKEADRKQIREYADIVRQISGLAAGLRVDERGLDVRFASRFAKDSDLLKVGLKPVGPDAWKPVPPEAVGASLVAEDSGSRTLEWNDVVAILKNHGIELPFLTVADPVANHSVFTVDVKGAVDFFKGSSNVWSKVDVKALWDELGKVTAGQATVPLKNPACGCSFVIKGFRPAVDAKTRFETTLPEAKDKPVSSCCVVSYYALLKGIAPALLAIAEPQERALFEPVLSTLPPEGKGGLAYAAWREKESLHGILRLGADEFKGLSACFSAMTALQMQKAMKAPKTPKPTAK